MGITELDLAVLLLLMVFGYLLAKLPLFKKVNNEWIELILLTVGGLVYLFRFDYSLFKFAEGAVIGIAAAGSYNLLNNLPNAVQTLFNKFIGVEDE